jgi:predicted RNA methylase
MADFTQKTNVKSSVRRLAAPIADISAFDTIVQSVILNNPFGCVSYMNSGSNHPPVQKIRELYTAKFVYQNEDARTVGRGNESYGTLAGYNDGIAAVLANTANNTAHAGTPYHDADNDSFTATLKCHDPNGELYLVSFSRQQVTVSSYEDDAIRTRIETWADGVAALA